MAIKQPGEKRQPAQRDARSSLAGDRQPDPAMRGAPAGGDLPDDLRQLQQALAESRQNEQLLAGLIESAMDAIISVDESQNIVQFNPAAELMFGFSATEVLGRPIETLLPENSR
ncbi:MAG: PAS domain S-box protein, partial [Hyphomicrobiaceae bacterium]